MAIDLSPTGRVLWAVGPSIVRGVARLAWRLRVEGEGFPSPPYVVAGNHPSAIDPVLVGMVHRRPVLFLAVDELYGKHRMLDWALRTFGAVSLPRRGVPLSAMRAALAHLAEGGVVGVFPEGTRVPRWGEGTPRPGAAWLAVRTGVPLVPVAISGSHHVFTMENRFGAGRLRMAVGPPLVGTDVPDLMVQWVEWIDTALDAGEPRSTYPGPGSGPGSPPSATDTSRGR